MNDEYSTTYQPISMGSSVEVLYPVELRGMMREEADSFRRMVSRQQKRKYQAFHSRFKEHKELFQKLINDGKWMVSKAGVAEYAYMVYTTAYLKRHYEREYTEAALLVVAGQEF